MLWVFFWFCLCGGFLPPPTPPSKNTVFPGDGKKEQNCKMCASWLGTVVKCLSISSHKLKET